MKNDSGALTTYSYNVASELVLTQPPTGRPTTATWDANGNLLVENAGGSLTSYVWDDENRLLSVNAAGSIETYTYSADGHRQKKVTGSGTTLFLWDGENVLLELNGSLVAQAEYCGYPGIWGGLASQRRSGTSSFYGFDLQASARVLVSTAGAVTDSYSFKAFGEELAATGSTINPHRYVGLLGYQRDIAARLYVRARYLRVDLGQWAGRDPGEAPPRYPYLAAEPVGDVDPSGRAKGKCTPGGSDRRKPPDCSKCGPGCKPVYFTCYSAPHRTAVYCNPNDTCLDAKGHKTKCCDLCNSEGRPLGSPVFPRGSTVCVYGTHGAQTRPINDCGCGQDAGNKPQPDNWMDWGAQDCSTFTDGWRCVCPGRCP